MDYFAESVISMPALARSSGARIDGFKTPHFTGHFIVRL
jgi:hypothetical protein